MKKIDDDKLESKTDLDKLKKLTTKNKDLIKKLIEDDEKTKEIIEDLQKKHKM